MSYVKTFKSFQNAEKKAAETVEAGANPTIAEQATSATTTQAQQPEAATKDQTPAPQPKLVEADPAVIAARSALATATANRDRTISAKEAELEKLKADQNVLVNNATAALNNALQKAATSK